MAVFPCFIRLGCRNLPCASISLIRFNLLERTNWLRSLCAVDVFSAELDRLKQKSAAYLVLIQQQPWWWSERYDNFWSYLDRVTRAHGRNAGLRYVIFELGTRS